MVNERKTEDIVREHFKEYADDVTIEEQRSDSARIQKLLAAASKQGQGQGQPDFIISVKNHPGFLIVVECKGDPQRHESPDRTRYADFAVDGALLYASHLADGYDVLAIGVSGTRPQNLRVSHHLHLKGEFSPRAMFGGKLLPVSDYTRAWLNDPGKVQQDYDSLLTFTQELNKRLHGDKIVESDRALLISSVLIALERDSFRKAYTSETAPGNLAKMITDTVSAQLKEANIPNDRLSILDQKFGFIKAETVLTSKPGELMDIVWQIDHEVNSFIRNHEYQDVLGQLYVEFLRYANSDKGLGIVLTPPHITDFFAELAQVNKESVVYDNCAGTGGFLISAMARMVADAKGDERIERRIKSSQLYGVEIQSSIYPLAVSNMYIHQDGKTNVYLGDCFDQSIIEEIRQKNPTVGLLNPPYKADKTRDTEELEFVLNNLDCLQQGGTCIAIAPMQCALTTNAKIKSLQQDILKKHTLEGVLSMPDELFFNSNVGVVSCIMIFTAHKPHPETKEVYFGFYKDDGLVKRKGKGRVDEFGKWNGIRAKWIANYINRTQEPGFSISKRVGPGDEWAAEAYLETDYSVVSDALFLETLHNYSTYLFANKMRSNVSDQPAVTQGRMVSLDPANWEWFGIDTLFNVSGTKTTPLRELKAYGPGECPYVSTQATNNGVAGFFDFQTEGGGVLTVDSAVAGYCAYQKLPFSASDHVEKLTPKFPMNDYVALFLATIINMEQYRYNYGRKCSQSRLREAEIKLPATSKGDPDFAYMERYIRTLPYSSNLQP